MTALLLVLTLAGRCATVVAGAHPATAVHSAPNGATVQTLPRGSEVRVDEHRGDWLHISAPAQGWIAVSATTVYCGSNDLANIHTVLDAIDKVGGRARSDRLAADTLMRYWVFGAADGYAGETAKDELAAVMVANPTLFTAVVDQLPPAKRQEALRTLRQPTNPRP